MVGYQGLSYMGSHSQGLVLRTPFYHLTQNVSQLSKLSSEMLSVSSVRQSVTIICLPAAHGFWHHPPDAVEYGVDVIVIPESPLLKPLYCLFSVVTQL